MKRYTTKPTHIPTDPPGVLAGLADESPVTIQHFDGRVIGVGKIYFGDKGQYLCKSKVNVLESSSMPGIYIAGDYAIKHGRRIDSHGLNLKTGSYFARPSTAEQVAIHTAEFDRLLAEQEAREESAKQAAYDALPEWVKLSKKLHDLCTMNPQKKWETAPIIEALRTIIEWAAANNLEMELLFLEK